MKSKKEISEIFKAFQMNIKKAETFDQGQKDLLKLRIELLVLYKHIFEVCHDEDYSKMPLKGKKTIGYYLFHLIRIEDIVSNTLILQKQQIFYEKKFSESLNTKIMTTGNEIPNDKLIEFSQKLSVIELKNYLIAVMNNTNKMIQKMSFTDSKKKVLKACRSELLELGSVSLDEKSFWLVDYWCNKNYAGLLLVPISRHHMMHLNDCFRIIEKLYLTR